MKHAGAAALERLTPLIDELRRIEGLVERSRGVFYRKGRAFLHFHEEGDRLFADLRAPEGVDFERFEIAPLPLDQSLIARVKACL